MVRALFGGSFDPVHAGHTALVDHVLTAGLADFVHVVPAWHSPHKSGTVASAEDRLAMVRLAFNHARRIGIETREIDRGRPSYTVDTLLALKQEYAADTWLLLIGADNLAGLARWHDPQTLQAGATVVVLGRREVDLSVPAIAAAGLDPRRFQVVPDFAAPVSSTAVRAMLAGGVTDLGTLQSGGVPAAVARYILARKLYVPESNGGALVPDSD